MPVNPPREVPKTEQIVSEVRLQAFYHRSLYVACLSFAVGFAAYGLAGPIGAAIVLLGVAVGYLTGRAR